ncbi:MAG TPA: hypothetical protein DDX71_05460 [Ruminococcus sp.]|nr:hypothetical protein [Ruminococcus sp.]
MFTSTKWIAAGIAAAAAGILTGAALMVLPHSASFSLPSEDIPLPAAAAETLQMQNQQVSASAPQDAAKVPDLPEKTYLLKLRGDTLYVYEEGAREASEEYDLPAGWLPDYDRILLEYGMRCTGEQEMRSLVEDYVS